jgi:hypothetical protein
VEAFDLVNGRTLLTLNLRRVDPAGVTFTAGNTMLIVDLKQDDRSAGSVLVPLADTAIGQFAAWLVPRPLSDIERCLVGSGEAECLQDTIAAPSHPGHEDRR